MSDISYERTMLQLIKFAFPSVAMMFCMSLYVIVDGIFVARFVGPDALAGLNIAFPMFGLLMAIGMMFGTGGSAYVAYKMGCGKTHVANRSFSLIVLTVIVFSILLIIPVLIYTEEVCRFLGADDNLVQYAVPYLFILMLFAPFEMLQSVFQCFFVTAGRPKLGFLLTTIAGIVNIVLDYILIDKFDMGISGAAYATVCGFLVPSFGGLWFFFRNKQGLYFMRPIFSPRIIGQTMFNGCSEMVSLVSQSVTGAMLNIYMMYYAGATGVSALTAAFYFQMVMYSAFLGFSIGVSPIISYHYGMQNNGYLRKALRWCFYTVLIASMMSAIIGYFGSGVVVSIFFEHGSAVYETAQYGLKLFAFAFLFAGINIFTSALFTALGNGLVSGIVAFLRTLVFLVLAILILPKFLQVTGLWLAIPFAELLAVIVCCYTVRILNKNYQLVETPTSAPLKHVHTSI